MERSAWTDERLDDMASRQESQFESVLDEIRQLRSDMNAEFRALRGETQAEFRDMRGEMHAEFRGVRRDMFHGAIAFFGSQVALLAGMLAVLLSG